MIPPVSCAGCKVENVHLAKARCSFSYVVVNARHAQVVKVEKKITLSELYEHVETIACGKLRESRKYNTSYTISSLLSCNSVRLHLCYMYARDIPSYTSDRGEK